MCPHANGDALPNGTDEMVAVGSTSRSSPVKTNGINGHANGVNGHANSINGTAKKPEQKNPYAPRASDFLSNISNFNIIESTLRGK